MNPNYCLTPGTILGNNYQIIKMIGRGGMGSVYMAYDMHLDLQVAVKILSPELAGSRSESELECVLKRFETEAKIAARIDHPNVIRIYGFKRETIALNDNSREIDYLVMELLPGRTLRNTMDVSGFEHEKEIRGWIGKYMVPILEGLQKVHESGIVHRDIKPENFLMKDDIPKLADFGLSMGFNLPSVTGPVADIFGTITYMAPEQFYNFSMARATADVYSIGKILYEAVEGKISDKAALLKQAKLARPDTDFLRNFDGIIRDATAENVEDRIPSVDELRKRLLALIYDHPQPSLERRARIRNLLPARKGFLAAAVAAAIILGAWGMHVTHDNSAMQANPRTGKNTVRVLISNSAGQESAVRGADDSIMHLIPPAELQLEPENILGSGNMAVDSFYLSESPVTNQQYVIFLNRIIDRVTVRGADVFIDGRLALNIGEKIRGYTPISHDGGRFRMQDPMHSACSVLLVTGYGAEVYADHYGMRLPSAREWMHVMLANDISTEKPIPLPAPVINYPQNHYGLRGVNQVAEWGKTGNGDLFIQGRDPEGSVEKEYMRKNSPDQYYTDTSFRIARDAG